MSGLMVGTELPTGKGMMSALLGLAGIETVEGESDAALKARLIQISTDGFFEVERVLSALPRPFLGGAVQVEAC